MANLRAEGWRKIIVEKGNNKGKWRAVRGFWEGINKDRWKNWLWCCDQRRVKGQMDHSRQNCRAAESFYSHGMGSGGVSVFL